MKKILIGLIVFPLLTNCSLSTKISDWTGWDLIFFVIGIIIFCFIGNLIYQSIEETRVVDQKIKQEEELIRKKKHKEHIKKMNEGN